MTERDENVVSFGCDFNLTEHYITETYFLSRWPEFTVGDIVWYVLKL